MKCLPLQGLFLVAVLSLSGCPDQGKSGPGSAAGSGAAAAASGTPAESAEPSGAAPDEPTRRACREGLGQLLAALAEPLAVEVFVSRQSDELSRGADEVARLLSAFEKLAKGKLSVQVTDAGSAAGRDQAKALGLQPISIGDKDAVKLGYFGMVLRYGSEQEVIPVLSVEQLGSLEFWIANGLRQVRSRKDGSSLRIGVVTGKGEVTLSEPNLVPFQGGRPGPNLEGIVKQVMPFYELEAVDLSADIDPELRGLIITQPGEDYSEPERARIDAYLMKGRSLAVFASAVNVAAQDSAMTATIDTRQLDQLLRGYGVELQPASVVDPQACVRLPVTTQGGGTAQIRTPAMLQVTHQSDGPADGQRLDNSFAGFFRLDHLAFPFCSPLVPHPDQQPDARMQVVARSSPEALTNRSPTQELGVKLPGAPTGDRGQQVVALVVEGKLRSAIDEQVSAQARLLVVSSSQFLVNPFARSGNPAPMPGNLPVVGGIGGDAALQTIAVPYAQQHLTATILVFKNVLDWLAAENQVIPCSALLLAQPRKAGAKAGAGGLFPLGR